MNRIRWKPAVFFVVFVAVICALAAFGHQLGMSREALVWCQTFAGIVGAGVLAALPSLLKDENGDGVPDLLETTTTTTATVEQTTTEKRS